MILEMLTGGGLLVIGGGIGFVMGRFSRKNKKTKPICGCGHALAFHDPATGECAGMKTIDKHNRFGDWVGEEQVPCTCRQYDGPTPLPTVYAPEITER